MLDPKLTDLMNTCGEKQVVLPRRAEAEIYLANFRNVIVVIIYFHHYFSYMCLPTWPWEQQTGVQKYFVKSVLFFWDTGVHVYVGGLCMMFAMYGCLLCMLPSSCPCAHRLISLCLCELVLLFAASPISNLPKFSTLRHGIFVQNGPSPFCSPISFLKQGPTYGAIPEKHGLLRWWWWCCCC